MGCIIVDGCTLFYFGVPTYTKICLLTFGSRANVLISFCLTCIPLHYGQPRSTTNNHGQLRSTAINYDQTLSISRFSWQDDAFETWYNTSARMNLLPNNASWWNASGRAYPDVAALATPYQTVCDGFVQTGMIYREKSFMNTFAFSYFFGGGIVFSTIVLFDYF